MALEIDQSMNGVLTGDAGDQVTFVIEDAACEITCHSDVQGALAFAGQNVGVVGFIHGEWTPPVRRIVSRRGVTVLDPGL